MAGFDGGQPAGRGMLLQGLGDEQGKANGTGALRYGIAVLVSLAVVWGRQRLDAILGQHVLYVVFFPVIAAIAAYAGLWPGLLSLALLSAAAAWFWLPPAGSLRVERPEDALELLVFIGLSLVTIALLALQRRALVRSRALSRDLGRREERLRVMAETAPVMIWMAGPDRGFEYLSAPGYAFTGRSADADPGETWSAALHPDDRGRWQAVYDSAFEQAQPFLLEHRLRRADGVYRWVLTQGQPRSDGSGVLAGYIGGSLDVTDTREGEMQRVAHLERQLADRLRDEEVQAEERRRFEALLAEAQRVGHVGSWEWRIGEDRVWWSDEMYRIYGLDAASFRPSFDGFLERVPEADRDTVRQTIQRLLQEKGAFSFEHRILRPDGTERTLFSQGRVVLDGAEQPLSVRGTAQDVTERKRGETERGELQRQQAARLQSEESERRYRILADASDILSSSLDYESTLERVAHLLVPALADWCVIDVLDHHGQLVDVATDHVDPTKRERLRELRRRSVFDPARPSELVAVMKSGESRLVSDVGEDFLFSSAAGPDRAELRQFVPRSYMAVPLLARGRSLGVIGLASETHRYSGSDLKLAEELARRAALAVDNARLYREAQEASRLKDEFLATLSHELRTPLNAIVGWTHLLRTGLNEAEAARALEVIHRNAMAQNQLIGDVLDVSKIITGRLTLNLQSVDPAEVLETAAQTVKPSADAKQIRLQVLLDRAAGPVTGDAARLQQVVWNLLSNAIKFTPKGGRVQLRLMRVNSHVEIAVEDTGIGIRPDFLPYIFERFRQADSSTTRSYGGLGLGLALVRYLVELHGGTVTAQSRGESQGTTFVVKLPLIVVQHPGATEERVHPAAARHDGLESAQRLDGVKVLVVDDEPDARDLIATVLAQLGADVKAVPSSAEAMHAIEAKHPDVILSDLEMPDGDGYAFIRALRGLPPERGGAVPAVALTAYARAEDRVRALKAGFQMHVPKPVQASELAAVIESLVHRGPAASE
jgi:PAS domain S-box-containing protein